MEQELGRFLTKDEIVHHIDLDPTNNDPLNLIVLNGVSEHGRLHLMLRLALVKLLDKKDLRKLTKYLITLVRTDEDWIPARKKYELKRRKDAERSSN